MTVEALADGLGPGGYRMLGYMFLAALVIAILVVVGLVWLVVWLVKGIRAERRRRPETPER